MRRPAASTPPPNNGTLVEPSKMTVAEHLRSWLRYQPNEECTRSRHLPPTSRPRLQEIRGIGRRQIISHLGTIALQRLCPSAIDDWHKALLKTGRRKGGPLRNVCAAMVKSRRDRDP